MNRFFGLWLCLLLVVSALPAVGQATQEANGTVVDHEGNPVQGAHVIVWAESNPSMQYDGTTSKKGRYVIPGMFTAKENDLWKVTIEVEGYEAYEMHVESRTSNRTLIGDIRTIKLKPGAKPPGIPIRPFGKATVNFKVAPPDKAAELLGIPTQAQRQQAAQAQRKVDPWAAALTRAQDGDLEGSLELFDEAIEDEPESVERRKAYAQVLYQLDRYNDAEVQAKKAIELSPEDASTQMVLYTVSVGKDDMEQARGALERARELDPDNIDVLRQVAFVVDKTGTTQERIVAYEAVVEADPGDTETWLSLGYLYASSGNPAKSEEAYARVADLDPDNAQQVFFNLGALLMNAVDRSDDDTQKAIGMFRKAVEIDPKYAQAYRELAFALLNVGDRAGARQALEQYVEVAPNAPDVERMRQLMKALPQA